MAAKKRSKNSTGSGPPLWLAVVLALTIALAAAYALLSQKRAVEREALPVLADEPEGATQHDRDQIDEASRDQLRDILRAADNGD